jgi:hypothetical protein
MVFVPPIEVVCVNEPLLPMILSGIALGYFLGPLQSKRQCPVKTTKNMTAPNPKRAPRAFWTSLRRVWRARSASSRMPCTVWLSWRRFPVIVLVPALTRMR